MNRTNAPRPMVVALALLLAALPLRVQGQSCMVDPATGRTVANRLKASQALACTISAMPETRFSRAYAYHAAAAYYRTEPKQPPYLIAIDSFLANPSSETVADLPTLRALADDLGAGLARTLSAPSPHLGGTGSGLFNATGGLPSQATLVHGFAHYLVLRAEDELTLAFLDRVRDWFAGDSLLARAFPSTTRFVISSDAMGLRELGSVWPAAVRADLEELPRRLATDSTMLRLLIDNVLPECSGEGNKKSTCQSRRDSLTAIARSYRPYVSATYEMVRDVQAGLEPVLVARRIPGYFEDADLPASIDQALLFASMLAGDILAQGGTQPDAYMLGTSQYLAVDHTVRTMYLYLVAVEAPGDALAPLLQGSARGELMSEFNRMAESILSLLATADRVGRIAVDSASTLATQRALSATFAFVEYAIGRARAAGPQTQGSDPEKALHVARSLVRANMALEAQDYGTAVEASLAVVHYLIGERPLPPALVRTSSFAAKLAGAETSEDVADAIRSSAAPAGSYRSKRGTGNRQFGLTAYVGASAAHENATLSSGSGDPETFWSWGLHAPVGLEYSWGGRSSATSVLVSLVDLGAVVRYHGGQRINAVRDGVEQEAKVQEQPHVGLAQVFSPGLYLVRSGIGLGPVAVGAGFSVAPDLWPVAFEDGAVERARSIRISVFAGLDMPLLAF